MTVETKGLVGLPPDIAFFAITGSILDALNVGGVEVCATERDVLAKSRFDVVEIGFNYDVVLTHCRRSPPERGVRVGL